ncbi:MAG: hypothetical protein ACI9HK_002781, partial [Pirellulaceae bacterium]
KVSAYDPSPSGGSSNALLQRFLWLDHIRLLFNGVRQ